jgi:uncharacterized damage-inducible protein DinB
MKTIAATLVCAAVLAGSIFPELDRSSGQNPFTDAARAVFPTHQHDIVESFASMPQEKYGFKPTPALMSFAELATHIASANLYYCRMLAPSRPRPDALPKAATATREDLVKALQASFDFCAPVVQEATDASLGETVTVPSGKTTTRAAVLLDLVSGMDHHYGQAAAYLRLNGLLPPTAVTEPKK